MAQFQCLHSEIRVYTEIAMRALGTSMMALLVVAALFWGNCFSCPQVLLSASQHGCCHRTKAPKDDCKTQGLRNFVQAEKSAPVSIGPEAAAAIAPLMESAEVGLTPSIGVVQVSTALAVPLRI